MCGAFGECAFVRVVAIRRFTSTMRMRVYAIAHAIVDAGAHVKICVHVKT